MNLHCAEIDIVNVWMADSTIAVRWKLPTREREVDYAMEIGGYYE